MEKTLRENLEELLTMQISSIDLTRLSGNDLAPAIWRITLCMTPGGEQFRFVQLNYLGQSGSGIYYRTISEAEEYGRQVVRELFVSAQRSERFGIDMKPQEYDWYGRGGLAEHV